jgi:hypothetical protein
MRVPAGNEATWRCGSSCSGATRPLAIRYTTLLIWQAVARSEISTTIHLRQHEALQHPGHGHIRSFLSRSPSVNCSCTLQSHARKHPPDRSAASAAVLAHAYMHYCQRTSDGVCCNLLLTTHMTAPCFLLIHSIRDRDLQRKAASRLEITTFTCASEVGAISTHSQPSPD